MPISKAALDFFLSNFTILRYNFLMNFFYVLVSGIECSIAPNIHIKDMLQPSKMKWMVAQNEGQYEI